MTSRMLVVGTGPGAAAFARELERLNGSAPEVVGVIAGRQPEPPVRWPYLGHFDALRDVLSRERVSDVVVCLDPAHWFRVEEVARLCANRGIRMSIPVAHPEEPAPRSRGVAKDAQRHLKRLMDLTGAIAALVLAAPILVAAALTILVVDGRPVVFTQPRAGQHGRPFRILKFRTMQRDADGLRESLRAQNEVSAGAFKMGEDPRVTRLGRWLRRTSVDELPQLWNVLKGEMSLVGPRPHPYDDVARYEQWHLRRLAVKPGITGLWQVELRGDADFDRWVEKDIEYIERWSLWLDIGLIVRTIPAVLRGTGR
jgi:exopolysaccharide biosynthesis polyprenyl glycosylphosphotransferase